MLLYHSFISFISFVRVCIVLDFLCLICFFFFFKQKTAYEMRISDWSSDVCSSDLPAKRGRAAETVKPLRQGAGYRPRNRTNDAAACRLRSEIGRASCRERVCQYV